jgi:hypothetical protein
MNINQNAKAQEQEEPKEPKENGAIPPGPPGPSRITVVILLDNETGHAAGWNPPGVIGNAEDYVIQSAVDLEVGTFIEAMFMNPPPNPDDPLASIGECFPFKINTSTDIFRIL